MRRFGPAFGGWLVGLPFTCGPVALFVALERGPSFAARIASGAIAGVTAEVAFVLGYFAVASRGGSWLAGLAVGTATFFAAGLGIDATGASLPVLLACAVGSLVLGLRIVPAGRPVVARETRWDLPLRLVLATTLVLAITGLATTLGPGLSGLAITYPLITSTLAVFVHRSAGPAAAIAVYRGLLLGVFALTAFASTLVLVLTRVPLGLAFLIALALMATAQLGTLPVLRRAQA